MGSKKERNKSKKKVPFFSYVCVVVVVLLLLFFRSFHRQHDGVNQIELFLRKHHDPVPHNQRNQGLGFGKEDVQQGQVAVVLVVVGEKLKRCKTDDAEVGVEKEVVARHRKTGDNAHQNEHLAPERVEVVVREEHTNRNQSGIHERGQSNQNAVVLPGCIASPENDRIDDPM